MAVLGPLMAILEPLGVLSGESLHHLRVPQIHLGTFSSHLGASRALGGSSEDDFALLLTPLWVLFGSLQVHFAAQTSHDAIDMVLIPLRLTIAICLLTADLPDGILDHVCTETLIFAQASLKSLAECENDYLESQEGSAACGRRPFKYGTIWYHMVP